MYMVQIPNPLESSQLSSPNQSLKLILMQGRNYQELLKYF